AEQALPGERGPQRAGVKRRAAVAVRDRRPERLGGRGPPGPAADRLRQRQMLFGQGQCHCPPRQPVRSCSAPAHCRTPSAQEEPPARTSLLVSSKVCYQRVAYGLLPPSRTGVAGASAWPEEAELPWATTRATCVISSSTSSRCSAARTCWARSPIPISTRRRPGGYSTRSTGSRLAR